MMRSWIIPLLSLAMLMLVSCDLGTEPEETNGEDGAVLFSEDVQPVLTANCAFSSCHGTSNPQLDLVLAAGQTYENTVNMPSQELPEMDLIEPGKPDSSFLYLKINADPPAGERMPRGGPYLTDDQIETVATWIEEGAENN